MRTFWAQLDISATISEAWPKRPYGDNATSGSFTMKSGYGFQATVTTTLSTNYDKPETILAPQKVLLFTPETDYGSNGVMYFEPQNGVSSWSNTWIMPINASSPPDVQNRAWYVPVWFPDGREYRFFMTAYDAYTPAGALCATVHKSIHIQGNMYEDDVTITIPVTPELEGIEQEWLRRYGQ